MRNVYDGRTSTVSQCPMLAYHDGANACQLESGHDGEHENCFGDSCERYGWGPRADVIAYLGTRYSLPEWIVRRRDRKGNVRR